jgi:hypothetical protein
VTALDSRPGEGEAPGRACRIVNLTCNGGARYCVPFVLTAACGLTTTVEQGVEWGHTEGRRKWAAHECLPAAAVTA